MPIKEESFRIGCGRYIQGKGYIAKIGDEVKRLGKSALIVGGKTALSLTRDKIEKNINCPHEFITHIGSCNDEDAKNIADYAVKNGYQVIIGVGGGVICDFAKLCAHFAGVPAINVPTSSATCACYTPLSVRYTKEGNTVGTMHYDYEIDCVIADSEIIACQPARLLVAGVFDALAKFLEIKHRYSEGDEDYPLGLDYAYVMSARSFKILTDKTQKCIDDMARGDITDDVEKVIFTTLAATGVISGIARGSNQTALAHKFYETTRFFMPRESAPYLHGELVGIGLLLQNHFSGEEQNNRVIEELMKRYNMPRRISDVGIGADDIDKFYHKICDSSAIDKTDASQCARLKKSLEYLWGLK